MPSASAIRCSDCTVAPVWPRSSWLRKLSLSPARVAMSRRVSLRASRSERSRPPTLGSAIRTATLSAPLKSLSLLLKTTAVARGAYDAARPAVNRAA